MMIIKIIIILIIVVIIINSPFQPGDFSTRFTIVILNLQSETNGFQTDAKRSETKRWYSNYCCY